MGGGASSKYVFQTTATAGPPIEIPSWLNSNAIARVVCSEEFFNDEKPIGRGKFGFVFACRYTRSKEVIVAVKHIPKNLIFESTAIERTLREISILKSVRHPFAVRLYGVYDTLGSVALVMDYAPGGELYTRIHTVGKLTPDEAKFYFCELVEVLQYLHVELKVAYRDLKSENVLIGYDGHIKLCDFGFAAKANSCSTGLADACGTINYLSPEVAVGRGEHGFAVDWWALGCLLFEMLTGKSPFGDSDNTGKSGVLHRVISAKVNLPLFIDANLKELIRGLLDKNPESRFTSEHIIASKWTNDVNWSVVYRKTLAPPWVPNLSTPGTIDNFCTWTHTLPIPAPPPHVTTYCLALNAEIDVSKIHQKIEKMSPLPDLSLQLPLTSRGSSRNHYSSRQASARQTSSRQGTSRMTPSMNRHDGSNTPSPSRSRNRMPTFT